MKSYLQIILGCFESMDTEGLRLYLKEEYEYQGATKAVFLNKVGELFEQFKKAGDSKLEIFSGACCSNSCNVDLPRTGYRFIGNVTRNFFDLRFVLEHHAEGEVSDVKDIFNCNFFWTDETLDELGEHFEIRIFEDEQIKFNKTPEYSIHINKANQALEELPLSLDRCIDWEEGKNWLFRYKPTFEFFNSLNYHGRVPSWMNFKLTYRELQDSVEIFQRLAREDILEYSSLNLEENEEKLISRVLLVEEIFGSNLLFMYQKIDFGKFRSHWEFGGEFSLSGGPISEVAKWMTSWFNPCQKLLLEKYFALTEAELDQIEEFDEVPEFMRRYDLLTTHMDIRKEAFENGNVIPFYLGTSY